MPRVGHVTGSYTVHIGNSTWTVTNVTVNQPGDPSPSHAAWAYPPQGHPMSADEQATFCHGPVANTSAH